MTELILVMVIIALLAYIGWNNYEAIQERKGFMKTLMARTAENYRDITLAENIKVDNASQPPLVNPDFVLESELSDEEWEDKVLRGDLNGNQG